MPGKLVKVLHLRKMKIFQPSSISVASFPRSPLLCCHFLESGKLLPRGTQQTQFVGSVFSATLLTNSVYAVRRLQHARAPVQYILAALYLATPNIGRWVYDGDDQERRSTHDYRIILCRTKVPVERISPPTYRRPDVGFVGRIRSS